VGLIQNTIEGVGIATISITLKPSLTEQMNVPRAANIRFPYGHPVGPAFEPEIQIQILKDALNLIEKISEPSTIVGLPYRWRRKKRVAKMAADPRIQEITNLIDQAIETLKEINQDMRQNAEKEGNKNSPDAQKLAFYQSQASRTESLASLLEEDAITKLIGISDISGPIKFLLDKD
jgi:hypothetical protein